MAKAFRQELVEAGVNEPRLFDELRARLASLRPIALKVLGRWAQLSLQQDRSKPVDGRA